MPRDGACWKRRDDKMGREGPKKKKTDDYLVWQAPMQTGNTTTGVSLQASPLGGRRAAV